MNIDEALKLDNGARFFRGDLHVHSIVGSHDVKDTGATAEAIVQSAHAEGLSILAIADHNEITAVPAAVAAGSTLGMLVVPAVELSTQHGHVLCYLPTVQALTRFHAKLQFADSGLPNSRCSTGIIEVLDALKAEGGFAILAHVDGGKGLETVLPGNPPHKKDIICHAALLGIELVSATSTISYSDSDPNRALAQLGQDRIAALKLGKSQFLARVLNSDAHTLAALGRNAAGDNKVTRYKMQALSFDALRMALEDADARVRIEEEIPDAVPTIQAIFMGGGFLNDAAIHFSPNLNCIIGGRGTGKSTTFEAIRRLTGAPGGTDVVDSDVWPDVIDFVAVDQAGQKHQLHRPRDGVVENVLDATAGVEVFPIECYGQGQTQSISQKAQSDPAALLDYLDRFVDIEKEIEREKGILEELRANEAKIKEATEYVSRIDGVQRDLNLKVTQLAALEKANGREVIALIRKVEGEKQLRASIAADLRDLKEAVSHDGLKEHVQSIGQAADPAELVVGATEYTAIVAAALSLDTVISTSETQLKTGVDTLINETQAQFQAWRLKEAATLLEIETKKKALEDQGVVLDLGFINRLSQQEADLKERLRKLNTWVPALAQYKKDRTLKVRERWAVRARIAVIRSAFAAKSSETLKAVLTDLQVSLKFQESALSVEAASHITAAMEWRTSQVPRGALLTEKLTVPKLLDAIAGNDTAPIKALRTDDGASMFSEQEAQRIIDTLKDPVFLYSLQSAEVTDRPMLTVSKAVPGRSAPVIRDFSRLSLGQQQSVLLSLMLSSTSNKPLIIDQPEDNLDSEFIYQTLVPVLRRAKERRQVIIVTHNANIAVLGDAEQIIVLKSDADHARIMSRGSIDHPETRTYACAILEGAEEAFRRRATIYGIGR